MTNTPAAEHIDGPTPGRSYLSVSNRAAQSHYTKLVSCLFTFFSSTRLLTYLPTMWAICASADSSQYSIWTWIGWVAANGSMAAWLYEDSGRRLNQAVVTTAGNSLMCLVTCVLIFAFR